MIVYPQNLKDSSISFVLFSEHITAIRSYKTLGHEYVLSCRVLSIDDNPDQPNFGPNFLLGAYQSSISRDQALSSYLEALTSGRPEYKF